MTPAEQTGAFRDMVVTHLSQLLGLVAYRSELWERSAQVLEAPTSVSIYEPGTWGADAADALIAPGSRHLPEAA